MTKKLKKPLNDDLESEDENPTDPVKSTAVAAESEKVAASMSKKLEVRHVVLALPALTSGKKRKKIDEEKNIGGEDTKRPAFQRLWSEEDEINVLQGMIDFKADTGKNLFEDTNGYYDFIKKTISFDVSKIEFREKIRSLKKKYIGKENTAFTKPHDLKSLKLAKCIWAHEEMALISVKKEIENGEGDLEKKSDWFENSFLVKSIAGFGVDEKDVIQRWSLVTVENKKKIEEKIKKLEAKEMEYVMEKNEFLNEMMSMIAEASKNKSLGL